MKCLKHIYLIVTKRAGQIKLKKNYTGKNL